jgi:hypothetical protein
MDKTPYLVIGRYHPKEWRAWLVGRELCNLTRRLGLLPHHDPAHGPLKLVKSWFNESLHAEVRKRTSNAMSAEGWHYDGDTTPGANPECCLVLWASASPTEFKFNNSDTTYQPQPYEVVIAHNLHTVHRRPAGCPTERWVFRQRVAVPDSKVMRLP